MTNFHYAQIPMVEGIVSKTIFLSSDVRNTVLRLDQPLAVGLYRGVSGCWGCDCSGLYQGHLCEVCNGSGCAPAGICGIGLLENVGSIIDLAHYAPHPSISHRIVIPEYATHVVELAKVEMWGTYQIHDILRLTGPLNPPGSELGVIPDSATEKFARYTEKAKS